jgi:hypothetical protein
LSLKKYNHRPSVLCSCASTIQEATLSSINVSLSLEKCNHCLSVGASSIWEATLSSINVSLSLGKCNHCPSLLCPGAFSHTHPCKVSRTLGVNVLENQNHIAAFFTAIAAQKYDRAKQIRVKATYIITPAIGIGAEPGSKVKVSTALKNR